MATWMIFVVVILHLNHTPVPFAPPQKFQTFEQCNQAVANVWPDIAKMALEDHWIENIRAECVLGYPT